MNKLKCTIIGRLALSPINIYYEKKGFLVVLDIYLANIKDLNEDRKEEYYYFKINE